MRPATSVRVLVGVGAVWALTVVSMVASGDPRARDLLAQLLVVLLAGGGLAWAAYRFRIQPRRASFIGQASDAGLRAEAGDPMGVLDQPFRLFRRAASARDLENTAWGRRHGRDVVVADYWDAPGSDPSREDYRRVVCVIDGPRPGWPDLSVMPSSSASIAGAVGSDEVDTESERFNRAFEVRTADRRFATTMLDARMMEWLLLQGPGVGFEITAGRLMVFGPRSTSSLDDVDRALRRFDSFHEHVPAVVSSSFPDAGVATTG